MNGKLASLLIKITANGAEAEAELRKLDRKIDNFGKSVGKIGDKLSRNITLPFIAAAGASLKFANTQQQAEAKLLTALRGREEVQQRLIAQAAEMQSRSTFGDEAIIEQQAFLAALGLSEEQIVATSNAAMQLSAALGMDLDSATKNLAKTYGGLTGELGESIPALKGLTAEQLRAGAAIDFVNQNYQGFAETAAATGAGPLLQLKNQLGDIAEQLGVVLMPIMQDAVELLQRFADWLQTLSPATLRWVAGIGAFAAALGPVLTIGGKVVSGLSTVFAIMPTLMSNIPALGAKLLAFASGPLAAVASGLAMIGAGVALANIKDRDAELRSAYANARNAGLDSRKQSIRDNMMRQYGNASDAEIEEALEYYRGVVNADANRYASTYGGRIPEHFAEELGVTQEYVRALEDIKEARSASSQVIEQETTLLTEQSGIISDLQAKIAALEASRPFMQTAADIAAANTELARLRGELEALNSMTTAPGVQSPITATSPDLSGLTGMGSLGTIKNLGTLNTAGIAKFRAEMLNPDAWQALEDDAKAIASTSLNIGGILSGGFAEAATAISEGIAALITNTDFNPFQRFLTLIGDMLSKLGAALISFATTKAAAETALKSGAWPVALAAGIAATAAGAVLKNLANKPIKLANGGLAYGPTLAVVGDNPGAAHDPEVVAPLSKLKSYLGGNMQKLELVGEIELLAYGSSLRAVLNKENIRLAYRG